MSIYIVANSRCIFSTALFSTDFRRQNLTRPAIDVMFLSLKTIPAQNELTKYKTRRLLLYVFERNGER